MVATIQVLEAFRSPAALPHSGKVLSTQAKAAGDAFVKSSPRDAKNVALPCRPTAKVSAPKAGKPRPGPKARSKGGVSKQKMARFAVRSKNGLNTPNKRGRCKAKDFLGQRASWSPSVLKLRKVLSRQALAAAASPSLLAVAAWMDREDATPSPAESQSLGYLLHQPLN